MRRPALLLLAILAGCGSPDPVAAAAAGLRSSDPTERIAAIQRLAAAGPAVVPHLAGALGDRQVPVRIAAAEALAQCGADPALLRALATDPEPLVRSTAWRALAAVGATAAAVAGLDDADTAVRSVAAALLAGDPSGRTALAGRAAAGDRAAQA
ncbi:MAG: hypothetical protein RLZZ127_1937, partial [Planctomycetota bacterium]